MWVFSPTQSTYCQSSRLPGSWHSIGIISDSLWCFLWKWPLRSHAKTAVKRPPSFLQASLHLLPALSLFSFFFKSLTSLVWVSVCGSHSPPQKPSYFLIHHQIVPFVVHNYVTQGVLTLEANIKTDLVTPLMCCCSIFKCYRMDQLFCYCGVRLQNGWTLRHSTSRPTTHISDVSHASHILLVSNALLWVLLFTSIDPITLCKHLIKSMAPQLEHAPWHSQGVCLCVWER